MKTSALFFLCLFSYPGCVQLIPDPIWLRWWWETGGDTQAPSDVLDRIKRNYGNLLILRFIVLTVVCLFLAHHASISPNTLGFRRDQPSGAKIAGLAAGALLIGWARLMRELARKVKIKGSPEDPPHFLRQQTYKILFILILGAFSEELWRAVSLTISADAGVSVVWAVTATSIIFGIGHVSSFKSVGGTLGRALAPMVAGAFLAALFLSWRTLFIPLTAHVMLNSLTALMGRKRLASKESLLV